MSGNPILRTLAIAASAALLVTALAVPVAAGKDKVTVCHKPDTKAEKTLQVAAPAVKAHLKHGDYEGPCVADACTYLNKPELDANYASHGPVTLEFDGDENVWWRTHDPSAYHGFDVEFLPENGAPVVLPSLCPTHTTGSPWGPCVVWLKPPHDPGVVVVEWATEGSEPADWTVACERDTSS